MPRVDPKRSLALFLALAVAVAVSPALRGQNGNEATVLTTTGRTLQGTLSGLLDKLRLDVRAFAPTVAPDQAFDIPLPDVSQITIDFPRVILEAGERVFIGPYAAFQGIPEALSLDHDGQVVSLPAAGIRAIALHGMPLHDVPREWLGDQFLTRPAVLNVKPVPGPAVRPSWEVSAPPAESAGAESVGPTWEELSPPTPPSTQGQEWITLLFLLGIVGLVAYFLLAG